MCPLAQACQRAPACQSLATGKIISTLKSLLNSNRGKPSVVGRYGHSCRRCLNLLVLVPFPSTIPSITLYSPSSSLPLSESQPLCIPVLCPRFDCFGRPQATPNLHRNYLSTQTVTPWCCTALRECPADVRSHWFYFSSIARIGRIDRERRQAGYTCETERPTIFVRILFRLVHLSLAKERNGVSH